MRKAPTELQSRTLPSMTTSSEYMKWRPYRPLETSLLRTTTPSENQKTESRPPSTWLPSTTVRSLSHSRMPSPRCATSRSLAPIDVVGHHRVVGTAEEHAEEDILEAIVADGHPRLEHRDTGVLPIERIAGVPDDEAFDRDVGRLDVDRGALAAGVDDGPLDAAQGDWFVDHDAASIALRLEQEHGTRLGDVDQALQVDWRLVSARAAGATPSVTTSTRSAGHARITPRRSSRPPTACTPSDGRTSRPSTRTEATTARMKPNPGSANVSNWAISARAEDRWGELSDGVGQRGHGSRLWP